MQIVSYSEKLHSSLLGELTELLHEAYAPLAKQGLKFTATWQTTQITKERLEEGDPWLFFQDDKLVGTVTIYEGVRKKMSCEYYQRPGVFLFGQFCIKPEHQGLGLGKEAMRFTEKRAAELGAKELALDTSEQATSLINLYQRMGYQIVSEHQWPDVNYKSVIMSKELSPVSKI